MNRGLRIVREERPDTEEARALQSSIDRYNMDVTRRSDWVPVTFFLRDRAGTLRGGIVADFWGGWLHVRVLWIDADLRRQGHGARLLRAAEDVARGLGANGAFLETFSFQGATWYPRFGYDVAGVIEEYPPGHTYTFLKKRFAPRDAEARG